MIQNMRVVLPVLLITVGLVILAASISADFKFDAVTSDWPKFVRTFVSDWSPAFAVGATVIVAVLTWWNMRIARRSLAMLESRERRAEPQLDLDYVDAIFAHSPAKNAREFAALLRVTNSSDTDNSVAECNLWLRVAGDSGIPTEFVIRAGDPMRLEAEGLRELIGQRTVQFPLFVGAHNTVEGWATFSAASELLRLGVPIRHTVALRDTFGAESTVNLVFVRPLEEINRNRKE